MSMRYKKIFCSFADSAMWRSLNRIKQQAESMHIYDMICIYNEHILEEEFKSYYKEKLVPSRGFGYWVWKPQVLLQTLEKMDNGDILHYSDAGCHLNKHGIKRLKEYFEIANSSPTGILAFQSKEPIDKNLTKAVDLPEKHWTKGDILDYFKVRNNKNICESEQIGAGILFIKKTPESISILRKFLQTYYDDFSLADDTPSRSPNFEGFIENRHDQSIFSIIAKLNGVTTISSFEYWQPEYNFKQLKYYPIWAIRDKDYGNNITKKIKRWFKTIFLSNKTD